VLKVVSYIEMGSRIRTAGENRGRGIEVESVEVGTY
jgi:hypothetical protein